MSYEEAQLFSKELRGKALRASAKHWAWRLEDVPLVVEECRQLGFAILGSKTEFFLSGGTCELYWLSADPRGRVEGETWSQYVQRSCSEFLALFAALVKKTDFEKEGMESFQFLEDRNNAGINILDYLCFDVITVSEDYWLERHKPTSG